MTKKVRVLAVDDEHLIRIWLEAHLSESGYQVATAATLAEARKELEERAPDAMILDLRLPDGDGTKFLREALELEPDLVVILLSAHGDIQTAVESVKAGAYHFLEKPCSMDDLLLTLQKGLETRSLKRTVSGLRRQAGWQVAGVEIVGRSGAMQRIVDLIDRVASSEGTTVLVRGESGVGKEVAARAIHARSARHGFPFLEVNCTALPETLLESELFGYEKGAFTDARERKKGLLELADGGTVLLDEVGDLPREAQAKLLRFLETRRFKRVGGVRDIQVDVRIIASTNRDLEAAVADGTFRADLFYRLNVVPIEIPPLRHRPEDVEPLARHFLTELASALRRPHREFEPEAMALLESYPWPGNVRELRNVIERTMILEDDPVVRAAALRAALGPALPAPSPGGSRVLLSPEGLDLEALEIDLLRQALQLSRGSKAGAARLLGLSRDTLRYRIEKYGLEAEIAGEGG